MSMKSARQGLAVMAAGLVLAIPATAAAKRPGTTPPPGNNLSEWSLINLKATDVAAVDGASGIKVAVMDSLTDCRHSEFAGTPVRCENTLIEGGRYRFYGSHGTHVAGIVAGTTHGVAPKAHILNYAVFDDRFYVATGDKLIRAWRDASAKGATVTNMSFGCTNLALCFTAAEVSAMAGADLNRMLFVKAAGNDGVNLSNEAIAVSGETATAAMARLMLVGSADVSGAISSFSNRPGDNCFLPSGATACSEGLKWKYYFIVAPGRDIYSALPGGSFGYMSGTSMASPVVAGTAALLQKKWPSLLPETVAMIMFDTAADVGAPGVDAVYGWGLLDVGAAFMANGTVTVSRPDGTTTVVSGTTLTGSPTMSGLAGVLGDVTVYDKYGRDFALSETGALQVTPNHPSSHQWLGKRLLAQGSQRDWSSLFFAPMREARGFLRYGSQSEVAFNPFSVDRDARIGFDIPFKNGVAQLRMTGSSATRADFAHDPSLKPLSFFASTALLDSSLLGHAVLKVSNRAAMSLYAAGSTDPVSSDSDHSNLVPHLSVERQIRLISRGDTGRQQRKRTIGMGYWAQPDSLTVVGLNASVIEQNGGWYDIGLHTPEDETSTRIFNVGALASRRIGPWEASVSAELSHLRTSGTGLFSFTPAAMVSGEARIQRSGILFEGPTPDSLAFALSVPPRPISGSLSIDHMTRTEDGLGRRAVSFSYPLADMGAPSPNLEAAYRLGNESWSLGVAGGLDLGGETGAREIMVQMRLPL